MSFSSQFALSLELTKFVPGAALVGGATRNLIHLMRELQNSGSDIITEGDLAEIFGRNKIEPRFASGFRTAVKKSAIHKFADIAELIIEAGAGPTVRRSLKEPAYFSTIIQISLLTWAHNLSELSSSLAQVLQRRATDAPDVNPPRYDALKGTLRACREQTSGYMWELQFSAVEKQLEGIAERQPPYDTRPIPVPILQSLLDSFTAVQHLPEHTLIRIKATIGIPTIVVWAHLVLGLTVLVETAKGSVRFGEGSESVYIDGRYYADSLAVAEAVLLNETDDILFKVVESNEDAVLGPACRHPILGFGSRVIGLRISESYIYPAIIDAVGTSCIHLVQQESRKRANDNPIWTGKDFCPTPSRVLLVGRILFPQHEYIFDSLDLSKEQPCLIGSNWGPDDVPPVVASFLEHNSGPLLKDLLSSLAYLVFVFSMIENLEDYPGFTLDLYSLGSKSQYSTFRLLNASEAFSALTMLLHGKIWDDNYTGDKDNAAVISAWGWSIGLSSIASRDPSDLRSGITIYQGVPMRAGERKRFIVDGFKSSGASPKERQQVIDESTDYEAVAKPGEKIDLRSWTRPKKTKYLLGVSDTAFEVVKIIACESITDPNGKLHKIINPREAQHRFGLRLMQDVYWKSIHLPMCGHSGQLGQIATLPQDTWAFEGFRAPVRELPLGPGSGGNNQLQEWMKSVEGSIHIGLVAGDSSARWLLLAYMTSGWGRLAPNTQDTSPPALLRSEDCCLECAIACARNARQGRHVGLVL